MYRSRPENKKKHKPSYLRVKPNAKLRKKKLRKIRRKTIPLYKLLLLTDAGIPVTPDDGYFDPAQVRERKETVKKLPIRHLIYLFPLIALAIGFIVLAFI